MDPAQFKFPDWVYQMPAGTTARFDGNGGYTLHKADDENGNGGDESSDDGGRRERRPDNKNKVDRKTRETRNRRERNIQRFFDGSFFDERGKEIFGMWLNGSGETANLSGDNWTKYMSSNELLTEKVFDILKKDASQRAQSGFLYVTTHAEIENGYFSGYEMLHGTDKNVGDFQIWGDANYSKEQVTYNLTLRWNDKIDPNFSYSGDVISSVVLHTLFNPKDYDIHITWNEKYVIKLIAK